MQIDRMSQAIMELPHDQPGLANEVNGPDPVDQSDRELQRATPVHPASERTLLGDVRLLSLGTGCSLVYIEGDRHDWGYLQWVRPLISLMLDGTNGIADYQCARILGDRYFRLAPTFPPGREIAMDDVNEIPYLVDFALSLDLGELVSWLRGTWVDLTP